jgi:hypothetical protein
VYAKHAPPQMVLWFTWRKHRHWFPRLNSGPDRSCSSSAMWYCQQVLCTHYVCGINGQNSRYVPQGTIVSDWLDRLHTTCLISRLCVIVGIMANVGNESPWPLGKIKCVCQSDVEADCGRLGYVVCVCARCRCLWTLPCIYIDTHVGLIINSFARST